MYIARDQMKLLEGRLPQKEDEVVVSRYFLSNYAADAGIGEKVKMCIRDSPWRGDLTAYSSYVCGPFRSDCR